MYYCGAGTALLLQSSACTKLNVRFRPKADIELTCPDHPREQAHAEPLARVGVDRVVREQQERVHTR